MTAPLPPAQLNELLDILVELQHDLGKYLRVPLGFLPAGASDAEVRGALRRALLQTRTSGGHTVSARQLWERACEEGGTTLARAPGFAAVEQAVERALAWEAALQQEAPVDRQQAQADLSGVAEAIRNLVTDLQH